MIRASLLYVPPILEVITVITSLLHPLSSQFPLLLCQVEVQRQGSGDSSHRDISVKQVIRKATGESGAEAVEREGVWPGERH